MVPNFSAYPWTRVPRVSRAQAALESTLARWIAARGAGERLVRLVDGRGAARDTAPATIRARVVTPGEAFDPHAACCEVRVAGAAIEVRGSSAAVRAIARRVLGGPDELAAARPLTIVEQSIWSLVVATALEDLGVDGTVWPRLIGAARDERTSAGSRVSLDVMLGDIVLAVELRVPTGLALRAPGARVLPAWADRTLHEVPIVIGRCMLANDDLPRLRPRSLVTLEPAAEPGESASGRGLGGSLAATAWPRALERRVPGTRLRAALDVLGGAIGILLTSPPAAHDPVVAEVATGYVRRPMSLPDDARVELTVALGTTTLSLRQLVDLAIGQIIPLGRPLAGPFELRTQGRVLGHGELVDVDGELAVRIVKLAE